MLLRVPTAAAFCGVVGALGDAERRWLLRVGLGSLAIGLRGGGLLGGGCFDPDELGRLEWFGAAAWGRDDGVWPFVKEYRFLGGLSLAV